MGLYAEGASTASLRGTSTWERRLQSSSALPDNLLDCRSALEVRVAAMFRAAFANSTLRPHGSATRSKRYVEVQHPDTLRYILIRQSGVCLLLERLAPLNKM